MLSFALKTLISAVIIALASELAKRSTVLAALIIALPLNSMLAFSLLYADTQDGAQVAALARSVLLLIVPSLVYFVLLPLAMRQGLGYWPASAIAVLATILANGLWFALLRAIGVAA
jgi:hypothetical protein